MVHISLLRLYRVRDALEDTLRRPQRDIRIRQLTKLPKRVNAETQVPRRESGESIAVIHLKAILICADWPLSCS